jgi:SAM-dependent methyltransferase
MPDIRELLQTYCYGKDLEQRKQWYSPSAHAYQQVRPRYPQALIEQVLAIAQLTPQSRILELGCGPAVATTAFAQLGCTMVCLEPNPDFYQLAQQACQPYPQVELQNCSFEEWQLAPQAFDAVLAASSFHWISPEIGHPKAAAALQPHGALILLWNKELQPSYDIYQRLTTVYAEYAPTSPRTYEDSEAQFATLERMATMVTESGYFQDLVSGWMPLRYTYRIDEYLMLLSTYSPHLQLESQQREALFAGIAKILGESGDTVELSNVSAFHIARPAQGGPRT